MTELSVIVPCYNVADHVLATLQSLRRNASPGVEFLLVNDASTDATPDILAAEADSVPGARVLTVPANRGLSAARNLGLDAATGTYLAFLDGDDFVAPDYYQRLLATIRRLGAAMIRTDHVQVRGRRRSVHRINHGPRGVVMRPRDAILPVHRPTSVDAPYAWAGIFHRSVADAGLLRFNEQLRTCEDRPWCWRLHLGVPSFAVVGMLGVFYRRDVSTSLTQQIDARQLDFLTAYDLIIAEVADDADAGRLLPKAVRSYLAMVCHHLRRTDRYPPALRPQLRELSAQAIARLPAATVREVVTGLDRERRSVLAELADVA